MPASIRSGVPSRGRSYPTTSQTIISKEDFLQRPPKGFRVILELGKTATEEEAEKLITTLKNPLTIDRKHFDIQPITGGA